MPTQLRIYTLNRGALAEFAAEWRDQIAPLRQKLGFRILGAWSAKATNQFVWLLAYDGPQPWELADQAYYQAPERRAMSPDPARHIARVEQYFVDEVRAPAGPL
jgi:hypothetical protein